MATLVFWCAMQPAVAPLILLTLLCVRFSL
jgi:hypothetical protein